PVLVDWDHDVVDVAPGRRELAGRGVLGWGGLTLGHEGHGGEGRGDDEEARGDAGQGPAARTGPEAASNTTWMGVPGEHGERLEGRGEDRQRAPSLRARIRFLPPPVRPVVA